MQLTMHPLNVASFFAPNMGHVGGWVVARATVKSACFLLEGAAGSFGIDS